MKTICLCTSYGVLDEPRFRRHTLALAAAFPDWRLIAIDSGPHPPTDADRAAFAAAGNVDYRRAVFPSRVAGYARVAVSKLSSRLARGLYTTTRRVTTPALSNRGPALARSLRSVSADAFIGYNIDALRPVGRRARQTGASLIFDCMEYYSDMGPGQSRLDRQLIRKTEAEFLPRCQLILASSSTVADAVSETYGVTNVVPIYNTPPRLETIPSSAERAGLSLYWRNNVVGLSTRGLDDLLVAISGLPDDVRLTVRGRPAVDQGLKVAQRISELGLTNRVHVLPPHLPDEGVLAASEHHVGVCPEQGGCRNMDATVSNKLFDFMMAGLAVVVSDLTGIRTVVERAKSGIVFRNRDPLDLRVKLCELYDHPDRRREFAANARRFALSDGNLEREMDRLVEAMGIALGGTSR